MRERFCSASQKTVWCCGESRYSDPWRETPGVQKSQWFAVMACAGSGSVLRGKRNDTRYMKRHPCSGSPSLLCFSQECLVLWKFMIFGTMKGDAGRPKGSIARFCGLFGLGTGTEEKTTRVLAHENTPLLWFTSPSRKTFVWTNERLGLSNMLEKKFMVWKCMPSCPSALSELSENQDMERSPNRVSKNLVVQLNGLVSAWDLDQKMSASKECGTWLASWFSKIQHQNNPWVACWSTR